jgi:hypothetical protein
MMETTRGMIGDLSARGEQIQETALSKDDHGWGQMSRILTDSGFREGQVLIHEHAHVAHRPSVPGVLHT